MKKMSNQNQLANCPIYKSNKVINMFNFNYSNLDNYTLYQFIEINMCIL